IPFYHSAAQGSPIAGMQALSSSRIIFYVEIYILLERDLPLLLKFISSYCAWSYNETMILVAGRTLVALVLFSSYISVKSFENI
ncbi:hypothetical protein V4Y02_23625, partial [Escherichia coli]